MTDPPQSQTPAPVSDRPRRVRGGVRLSAKELPLRLGWAAQAWLDAVHRCADPAAIEAGFQYARAGQTRTLEIHPGRIVGSVQGRAQRAYRVVISVRVFSEQQWRAAVTTMGDNALYGAKMLAGEMPYELVDLFAAQGLSLAPAGPDDLSPVCSAGDEPWCKHACCLALLVAEAIDRKPWLMLDLRGMPAETLLDRLRDQREAATASSGVPGVLHAGDFAPPELPVSPPLEACLDRFWHAGPELDRIETAVRRPEVSHALLRRLGPSPFAEGRFPLVGLLATCYDTISRSALESINPPPASIAPAGGDTIQGSTVAFPPDEG